MKSIIHDEAQARIGADEVQRQVGNAVGLQQLGEIEHEGEQQQPHAEGADGGRQLP